MRNIVLLFLLANLLACATAQQSANQSSHGLNRTSRSMRTMAKSLQTQGYKVCNIDYPSRYFSVEKLANEYVLPKIEECVDKEQTLHFVTHSLGGIIIRALDEQLKEFKAGRFVMLSPPNQGSEAVDKLQNVWGFKSFAGPAGSSLTTKPTSVPNTLPLPSMSFAIIAATRSNSPLSWIIPGDDDGKVTLERMRLQGMSDYLEVSTTHSA